MLQLYVTQCSEHLLQHVTLIEKTCHTRAGHYTNMLQQYMSHNVVKNSNDM